VFVASWVKTRSWSLWTWPCVRVSPSTVSSPSSPTAGGEYNLSVRSSVCPSLRLYVLPFVCLSGHVSGYLRQWSHPHPLQLPEVSTLCLSGHVSFLTKFPQCVSFIYISCKSLSHKYFNLGSKANWQTTDWNTTILKNKQRGIHRYKWDQLRVCKQMPLIPSFLSVPSLEALHIGWTNLHHHSVVYLCLCAPPTLTHLNISGCRENITDEGKHIQIRPFL